MRNPLIAPLSAVAMLLLAATANAEDVTGVLASISTEQGTIILDSGESFVLAEGVSLEGVVPGMQVIVTVEEQNGQLIAMDVKPAE